MNIKIHDMRTKNCLSAAKAILFLMMATLTGSCTDQLDEGIGKPLPEGKYPVEFTSATYNMEVGTRAITENSTWTGGERVALRIGTVNARAYIAQADGSLSAASNATPFYWTSTGESLTVSAWYNAASSPVTRPTSFTVKDDQSTTGYVNSDLIMACKTVKFTDSPKKLTFYHLPAKVTITLTGNDAVPDLSGAVVTLKNVNLKSGTITANTSSITVAQAAAGTSTITPKRGTLSADKKTLTVQALVPPQDVSGTQFIEITVGGNTYTYTPKTGDGLFEMRKAYGYQITLVGKDKLIVTTSGDNAWTSEGNVEI